MRDLIWTIIVIWFVYRLVDLFKSVNAKRSYVRQEQQQSHTTHNTTHHHHHNHNHSQQDIQNARKKHVNNEGEYVDYEEIK